MFFILSLSHLWNARCILVAFPLQPYKSSAEDFYSPCNKVCVGGWGYCGITLSAGPVQACGDDDDWRFQAGTDAAQRAAQTGARDQTERTAQAVVQGVTGVAASAPTVAQAVTGQQLHSLVSATTPTTIIVSRMLWRWSQAP